MTKKKVFIIIAAVLLIGVIAVVLLNLPQSEKEPKEQEVIDPNFKGIVVGISDVDLTNPAVMKNGVVYADLRELGEYLNATTSISLDGKVAMVTVNGKIYTFELGKKDVTVTDIDSNTNSISDIKNAPKATEGGMDIDAMAFAKLLGFDAEIKDDVLFIK